MFKKFFSTLICVSMLAMLLPMSAFAANAYYTDITGWGSSFLTYPSDEYLEGSGVYLVTDESIVESGKAALSVVTSAGVGNLHANAAQTINMVDGKSYRLTGRVYIPQKTWRYRVNIGDKNLVYNIDAINGGIINAWSDMDYTFTYVAANHGNSTQIRFQSQCGAGPMYLDNLSVKEVLYAEDGQTVAGYGEELLENGDFEADFAVPEAPYFAQVAPANAKNHIAVKSNLSNIAIYQVADGVETKLDLGNPVLDRTDFKLKVFEHANLTNDTEYTYVIKNVSATGVESTGIVVSGTPKAAYSGYVAKDNWSFKSYGNAYGTFDILNGIGRNQSAGMKLTNMNFTWSNSSYVYATGSEKINLDTTKTYKLTYWVKSSANNQSVSDNVQFKLTGSALSADGVTYQNSGATIYEAIPAKDEWMQRTLYCKPTVEANQIEIKAARHIEEMIFDDFEIYEVDANLAVVDGAKNLCADGNFNFEAAYKAPDAPYFVQVAPRNAKNLIAVKTTAPAIAIYQVVNGVETKLNLGDPVYTHASYNLTMYAHTGLTNDTEYQYIVKAVSALGKESEGVSVAGTPAAKYDGYVEADSTWSWKSYNINAAKPEIINGIGRDQSAAMKLTTMYDSSSNNNYVDVVNNKKFVLDPQKLYKLTFWVKTHVNNSVQKNDGLPVIFTGAQGSLDNVTYNQAGKATFVQVLNDGQWSQKTVYVKPTAAENKLSFRLQRHYQELIVDDFELYEIDATTLAPVAGATNVFAGLNFDFELAYQPHAEASFVSVAARNAENYIAVKTDAPAIAIYQVADGVETKLNLEEVYNHTSYKLHVFAHKALENEKAYNYIVKTVTEKGIESAGISASGTPSAAYSDYIPKDGWSYKHIEDNYGTFAIKSGVGKDGSSAMYVTNMYDSWNQNDYLFAVSTDKFTLDTSKTYKLTFWVQSSTKNTAQKDGMKIKVTGAQNSTDGITYAASGKDVSPVVASVDGWLQKTVYVKPTTEVNQIEMKFGRHFESLILDEFELYEVDANLAVVDGAKNLLADGNYDFDEEEEFVPLSATFKFYPADSEGEIIDDYGISALSDLTDIYETNHLYAEAAIMNPEFASGKAFRMYVAVYKNKALFDIRSISATAAYRPGALTGEKFGQVYTMPDMTDGEYEVKVFLWDTTTGTTPIVDNIGAIGEF